MNIEVIKDEKNDYEIQIDNLTVAEILRVYLNEQGVDFAAWRREHPFKPILFKIMNEKGVKKAIGETVSVIKKDLDKIESAAKKK